MIHQGHNKILSTLMINCNVISSDSGKYWFLCLQGLHVRKVCRLDWSELTLFNVVSFWVCFLQTFANKLCHSRGCCNNFFSQHKLSLSHHNCYFSHECYIYFCLSYRVLCLTLIKEEIWIIFMYLKDFALLSLKSLKNKSKVSSGPASLALIR